MAFVVTSTRSPSPRLCLQRSRPVCATSSARCDSLLRPPPDFDAEVATKSDSPVVGNALPSLLAEPQLRIPDAPWPYYRHGSAQLSTSSSTS
eukprot:1239384-Rhodomonas_salina.1